MRNVVIIGMGLGLFGPTFVLWILPMAVNEAGAWTPEHEYAFGTGMASAVELVALALAVKGISLLKLPEFFLVKLRSLRAR